MAKLFLLILLVIPITTVIGDKFTPPIKFELYYQDENVTIYHAEGVKVHTYPSDRIIDDINFYNEYQRGN